ncbi:MAG TPA: PspC domain-containing protein [Trueperaceae bacterium]
MTEPSPPKEATLDPLPHNHRRARRPTGASRLRRSGRHGVLAGVLAGLAEFMGANPLWLRIGFVLSVPLTGGLSLFVYLLLWLLLPGPEAAPRV